jgi:hypothetical protein
VAFSPCHCPVCHQHACSKEIPESVAIVVEAVVVAVCIWKSFMKSVSLQSKASVCLGLLLSGPGTLAAEARLHLPMVGLLSFLLSQPVQPLEMAAHSTTGHC